MQYVEQAPRLERPSPAVLVLGNAVHAGLDRFFGLHPAEREPAVEVLHRCLRAVWPHHKRPDTFMTVEEERDYGEQGLRMLSVFAERFSTTATPLARERWVSTRLSNGVELYGKVDRVDGEVGARSMGTLDVIDYKTGHAVVQPEDVSDEPAAQAYLLAAEDEYAREVRRLRFIYLAHGVDVVWEPEREDVELAREKLLAVTGQMYTDQEFEPRPGEHCGRCPFAHACPDAGRVELVDVQVADDITF